VRSRGTAIAIGGESMANKIGERPEMERVGYIRKTMAGKAVKITANKNLVGLVSLKDLAEFLAGKKHYANVVVPAKRL
jgi:hypothetical protein